jgi:PAS domain S-box-containing protein
LWRFTHAIMVESLNRKEWHAAVNKISDSKCINDLLLDSTKRIDGIIAWNREGKIDDVLRDLIISTVKLTLDNVTDQRTYTRENEHIEVFKQINTWIWFSDINTKTILEVNPCFCKMLEIDKSEVEWQKIWDFFKRFVVDKEEYEKWKLLFKEHWKIASFELQLRTKTGKEKWFLVSSTLVEEANREVFNLFDITAIKDLQFMRENIIFIITHDVKSPMIHIWWFARRILKSWGLSEANEYYLTEILSSAERVEIFIKNYLDIMKMESGSVDVIKENVNLSEMLRNIVRRFLSDYAYKNFDVKINWNLLDDINLIWNKNKLEFCFENLIKNAFEETYKHSSKKIRVNIEEEGDIVKIFINNPWKISEKLKKDLFKKRCVQTSKPHGNWLGTYSAGLTIKMHSWQIYVCENSKTRWTTICIELPKKQKTTQEQLT